MVRRLFVEKKPGFDVEAMKLFDDLKSTLHIEGLEGVRVINRYDMDGVDDAVFENVKYTVFAEPAIDVAYEESFELGSANFFAYQLLTGQFDQRADSAEVCIRLINPAAEPVVRFAKVIVLEGNISADDLERVKSYCINPVDSQEASMEKPETLDLETIEPDDVEVIEGFVDMSDEELAIFIRDRGLAMTMDDIRLIHDYFKNTEKRNPSITEIKVIDTYWSDHCRHTTFNTKISSISFDDNKYGNLVKDTYNEYLDLRKEVYGDREKDISLMDMATIGAKYLNKTGKLDNLDESEEINAASIRIKAKIDGKEEDWLLMFKNETHNHPTEIEPFGGAATCLGGAIRDPLSGRSYVYQAMRVTGAGNPKTPIEDTLPGKLPQIKITREAAAGYSSYGNQIGLATGLVDEVYDNGYVAKRMEVGAVIGATPADHVVRLRPEKDDVVILLGGRTGRDGLGGATGSSKEHTEESMSQAGAEVQKGNPLVERNIQRMFRRKEVATLIKKCNDFGAGGVSVAIGELADGLEVYLDLIEKKYDGLDGTELAISESQERMAVVVAPENIEKFTKFAREENLEATVVAKVTDENRVVMNWRGNKILDLSRDFLDTNGAKQETAIKVTKSNLEKGVFQIKDFNDALVNLNCCSRKGLVERFDSTIGANTVVMPLGGQYQLTPAIGMAAKLPVVKGDCETASIMTYGYDPDIAKNSPYHGGMYAVIDSLTKVGAMGGDIRTVRLSFQEYFEKLTDDASWGKPAAALLGALKAQKELEVAAIGGKDSMSGTFIDIKVPPALISFAVTTADASDILSPELKGAGNSLLLVKANYDEQGLLLFDEYRERMDNLHKLVLDKKVLSANVIGKGGVFIGLVKMAVGNKIGVDVFNIPKDVMLNPNYGGLILEVRAEEADVVAETLNAVVIGETVSDKVIKIKSEEELCFNLDDVITNWSKPLEEIFPTKIAGDVAEKVETLSYEGKSDIRPANKIDNPKVVIPLFPGTNCELDSARAFERAGAITDIHLIRNIDREALEESIEQLAAKIKEANIVMIPGGFSGGDEPDGSAKFITAVFRNPKIKEAVTELLEERDGLMIGICNGFQALIKLGLVPYGKILDVDENSPTLSYNKIGRHMSRLVKTRISSVKSPWLLKTEVGEIFNIAVSHGEGRFICSEEELKRLAENGQIITQYVDIDGNATMDIDYNPNYSAWAVEGIVSPDGRVLGKMGHSERISPNVYKNIVGEKDMKLFESAVAYFRER